MEVIKMSSRGQIVIPQGIRDALHAEVGSLFAVIAQRDVVILKKLEMPSPAALIKELDTLATDARQKLHKKGIRQSDISKIAARRRNEGNAGH
jgi:AbrB family looped-hinge helix DNA binding protein